MIKADRLKVKTLSSLKPSPEQVILTPSYKAVPIEGPTSTTTPILPLPEVKSLLFLGRVPSKKNSRNAFLKRGRIFNIPSKQYTAWHKEASKTIQESDRLLLSEIDLVRLQFWAPDKRSADLTNKAESIMDLLVDNKVILDDNWYVVNRVDIEFKGVDRIKPRCRVDIYRKNTNVSNRLE